MADILQTLLQRIEEGSASPEDLERARALLDAFEWGVEGSPVRDALLEVPPVDVSGGVMRALGLDSVAVGEAVRAEAGEVDVVGDVFASLELADALPLGEALGYEAGDFDRADAVMRALDLDAGLPLVEAIAAEAGSIEIADAVMAQLGVELNPVAEAVRDAAGTVDVADRVMAALGGATAMPTPIAAPIQPAAANNGRRWMVGMLAAAMVAVVLGAGSLMGGGKLIGGAGMDMASGGGAVLAPAHDMVFASASEIVVEDLSFGEDVVVFQDEGDAGALILWVDEEVL